MEPDIFAQMFEKGKQKEIQQFRKGIENGRMMNLNIEQSIDSVRPQLGDSIIRASGLMSVIREYAKKNSLPNPKFGYSTDNTIHAEMYPLSGLNIAVKKMDDVPQSSSAIQKITHELADALNVSVSDSLLPLEQIPGHPWLNNFDRNRVEREKKQIRETTPGKITVIVQTGSDPIKRWSDEQVIQLANIAQGNSDRVIILSDASLNGEDIEEHGLKKIAQGTTNIETIFFQDIEDLAIYEGVADTFLSTDSGPSWIWGCERTPHSKGLIHHLVATEFWQVPGAQIVKSHALNNAQQAGLINRQGMLRGNNTTQRRDAYNELSRIAQGNMLISESDFQEYIEQAQKMLA